MLSQLIFNMLLKCTSLRVHVFCTRFWKDKTSPLEGLDKLIYEVWVMITKDSNSIIIGRHD